MLCSRCFTLPFYFYATIGFIIVTGFISMFLIIFIMSVNGIIHIIYASKNIRKKSLFYIVLMLFLILNLFCMIKLCRLIEVELYSNNKNYY
ncbi:hypothetical protein CDLVIII_3656 [Clostridium sp. DL-VIII]|nr:hypothetical protein CDLVIII_3656 [Clostridium sp. DL-VIII]